MKSTLMPFCLYLALIAFSSCGGDNSLPANKTYDYERADSLSTDYLRELGSVKVNIELCASLFENLQQSEYEFQKAILLPAGKSPSNRKNQAIALGQVSSSIVYCTQYEQAALVSDYVNLLFDLSKKLSIESAYHRGMVEQLVSIDTALDKNFTLSRAYMRAQDHLYSTDRAQIVSLMVFGGWVEGLYLALKTSKVETNYNTINIGVFDFVMSASNVEKMLEVFVNESQDIAQAYELFGQLKPKIEPILKSRGKLNSTDLENLLLQLVLVREKLE